MAPSYAISGTPTVYSQLHHHHLYMPAKVQRKMSAETDKRNHHGDKNKYINVPETEEA